MSALNITTDASGKVVKVMVDDKVIENVSDVSQNLSRGALVATIKASFDSITVAEQAGEPAPALTVAVSAGSVTGATKATITGEAGVGKTDIIEGLQRAANGTYKTNNDTKYIRHCFNEFAEDDCYDLDLTDADALMQIITFNELIYG